MTETLQNALIALFGSLGGDLATIKNPASIDYIIGAISGLGIGDNLKQALTPELPTLPDDDGTYTLQVVIDEGVATYSWEAATEAGT